MTDPVLERRCRRLARSYGDRSRAEEVLTTLLECNDGRRAPRPGDVMNVLWHGAVSRLRGAGAGLRLGHWGDAAAAAVVQLAVMQAAAAVALAAWVVERPLSSYPVVDGVRWEPQYAPIFFTAHEQRVAVAVAVLSLVSARAICLGRVRAARVLSAAAALAGCGGVIASWWAGEALTFRTAALVPVTALAAVVALGVVGTPAVARAAKAVPAWWWGMSGMAGVAAAAWAVHGGWVPFGDSRPGVLVVAFAAQAALVLLLAVPLARSFPMAFGGAAVVGLVAMPAVAIVVQRWMAASLRVSHLAVAWVAASLVVAALALRALHPGATTPDP